MQTVIETNAYLAAAKDIGMHADERQAVVDLIAAHPDAGEIMPGCGGARKPRVARPGGGKSGGYRIITYFAGIDVPVFLLTVFGKSEKTNLTKAERNALAALTRRLTDTLGEKNMKSAFDKIAAGLDDAIAYAGGDPGRGRTAAPIDVAAIRKRTGKTQVQFARAYRIPVGTVRDWEQSRSQPDAPARVLLSLIGAEPDTIERLVSRG